MLMKRRSAKFGTLQPPSKRGRIPGTETRPRMPGETITRYNKSSFKLSEAHQAKVDAGVKEVIEILKLQASRNNIGPLTGGIPLACNTMQSYGKHYESLKYFFGQIGDFESLLILQNEPLQYYPSMKPASIVLHHKWKVGASGSFLLTENGQKVLDLDRNEIRCLGSWISPENLEQCRSAISTLHRARNMVGKYQNPCNECVELDRKNLYHGCRFHR